MIEADSHRMSAIMPGSALGSRVAGKIACFWISCVPVAGSASVNQIHPGALQWRSVRSLAPTLARENKARQRRKPSSSG